MFNTNCPASLRRPLSFDELWDITRDDDPYCKSQVATPTNQIHKKTHYGLSFYVYDHCLALYRTFAAWCTAVYFSNNQLRLGKQVNRTRGLVLRRKRHRLMHAINGNIVEEIRTSPYVSSGVLHGDTTANSPTDSGGHSTPQTVHTPVVRSPRENAQAFFEQLRERHTAATAAAGYSEYLQLTRNRTMHSLNGNRNPKKVVVDVVKTPRKKTTNKAPAKVVIVEKKPKPKRKPVKQQGRITGHGDYEIGKNVGGKIGSWLGGKVHEWVSRIFGSGDYTVAAPNESIRSNSLLASSTTPHFGTNGDGETNVRFCERISYISIGPNFQVFSFKLDASSRRTFPWSYTMARLYQQYRINGMLFIVKSNMSQLTTGGPLGTVFGSARYDVDSKAAGSKDEAMNSLFAASEDACSNIVFPIECSRGQSPVTTLKVRHPGTTLGDEQFYSLGTLDICTEGSSVTTAKGLEVYVVYDITYMKPRLQFSGGSPTLFADLAGNNAALPLTFKADTALVSQPRVNTAGVVVDRAGVITFPYDTEIGALYRISVAYPQAASNVSVLSGSYTHVELVPYLYNQSTLSNTSGPATASNSGFSNASEFVIRILDGSSVLSPPSVKIAFAGALVANAGNLFVQEIDSRIGSGLTAVDPVIVPRRTFLEALETLKSGRAPPSWLTFNRLRLVDYVEAFRRDGNVDVTTIVRCAEVYDLGLTEALDRMTVYRYDLPDEEKSFDYFEVRQSLNGANGSYTGTDDVEPTEHAHIPTNAEQRVVLARELNPGLVDALSRTQEARGLQLAALLELPVAVNEPGMAGLNVIFKAIRKDREQKQWSAPNSGMIFVGPAVAVWRNPSHLLESRLMKIEPLGRWTIDKVRIVQCHAMNGERCKHEAACCPGTTVVLRDILYLCEDDDEPECNDRDNSCTRLNGNNGSFTGTDDVQEVVGVCGATGCRAMSHYHRKMKPSKGEPSGGPAPKGAKLRIVRKAVKAKDLELCVTEDGSPTPLVEGKCAIGPHYHRCERREEKEREPLTPEKAASVGDTKLAVATSYRERDEIDSDVRALFNDAKFDCETPSDNCESTTTHIEHRESEVVGSQKPIVSPMSDDVSSAWRALQASRACTSSGSCTSHGIEDEHRQRVVFINRMSEPRSPSNSPPPTPIVSFSTCTTFIQSSSSTAGNVQSSRSWPVLPPLRSSQVNGMAHGRQVTSSTPMGVTSSSRDARGTAPSSARQAPTRVRSDGTTAPAATTRLPAATALPPIPMPAIPVAMLPPAPPPVSVPPVRAPLPVLVPPGVPAPIQPHPRVAPVAYVPPIGPMAAVGPAAGLPAAAPTPAAVHPVAAPPVVPAVPPPAAGGGPVGAAPPPAGGGGPADPYAAFFAAARNLPADDNFNGWEAVRMRAEGMWAHYQPGDPNDNSTVMRALVTMVRSNNLFAGDPQAINRVYAINLAAMENAMAMRTAYGAAAAVNPNWDLSRYYRWFRQGWGRWFFDSGVEEMQYNQKLTPFSRTKLTPLEILAFGVVGLAILYAINRTVSNATSAAATTVTRGVTVGLSLASKLLLLSKPQLPAFSGSRSKVEALFLGDAMKTAFNHANVPDEFKAANRMVALAQASHATNASVLIGVFYGPLVEEALKRMPALAFKRRRDRVIISGIAGVAYGFFENATNGFAANSALARPLFHGLTAVLPTPIAVGVHTSYNAWILVTKLYAISTLTMNLPISVLALPVVFWALNKRHFEQNTMIIEDICLDGIVKPARTQPGYKYKLGDPSCIPKVGCVGFWGIAGYVGTVFRSCSCNGHIARCGRVGKLLPMHVDDETSEAVEHHWENVSPQILRILETAKVPRLDEPMNFDAWASSFPPQRRDALLKIGKEVGPFPLVASSFIKREIAVKDVANPVFKDPRWIQGCPLELSCAVGRYLRPWVKQVRDALMPDWDSDNLVTNKQIVYTCGLNAAEVGFAFANAISYVEEHMPPGDECVVIEDDQSRFDLHLTKGPFQLLHRIYRRYLPRHVAQLLKRKLSKGYGSDGCVYSIPYTMQSGWPDTSIGDTLINIAMKFSIHGAGRLWISIVCGDDSVTVTTRSELSRIGGSGAIRDAYGRFGMEIEVMVRDDPLRAEFCSGRFYPTCGTFVLMPRPGRLLAKICWDMQVRPYGERVMWLRSIMYTLRDYGRVDPLLAALAAMLNGYVGDGPTIATESEYKYYIGSVCVPQPRPADIALYYSTHYDLPYNEILSVAEVILRSKLNGYVHDSRLQAIAAVDCA